MLKKLNKIVVFGDIHGRDIWKDLIGREADADLFVFLGDYVSSHEGISSKQQILNLQDILEFKEENPNRVILLRGNHDLQHMGYSWAECSGYFREVERALTVPGFKNRYLADTQWVYMHNGIIFSHAGITERWFKDTGCEKIMDINNLEPSELFGFRPCKMSDYYGISATQGITWIRPQTLLEYALPGYTYVVGHTTIKRIINLKNEIKIEYAQENEFDPDKYPDIWICDTLPREYLVIENNEFKPTKI